MHNTTKSQKSQKSVKSGGASIKSGPSIKSNTSKDIKKKNQAEEAEAFLEQERER